jgi:MYXO-CTERM domain-containing protein
VAAALLLALSITMMGSTVYAQEGSPSAQASPVVQQDEDNDVPWGLLGLLGLGGLAGLRRRPEPVREEPRPTRRL